MHTADEVIVAQSIETAFYDFRLEEYWEEDDAGYCVSDFILAKHTRLSVYDRSGVLVRCFDTDSREYDKSLSLEGDILSVRWCPDYDRIHTLKLDIRTLRPLPYKLIAFDMDGTLLDSAKRIRQDSLEAIREASAAGKTVVLSTGRCMPELEEYLEDLRNAGLDFLIAVSGSLIRNIRNGQDLSVRPIPREVLLAMLERAEDEDIMVHILADRSYMQKDKVCHSARYGMGSYQEMFSRVAVQPENLLEYCTVHPFTVYKCNFYCQSPEQREQLKDLCADLPLNMAYSETSAIEYCCRDVSKASGLEELCRLRGIPVSESIAVGDADNDLTMLQTAGFAVAMGNANDQVKAAADAIVADNDHGGCAEAIRSFLLPAAR